MHGRTRVQKAAPPPTWVALTNATTLDDVAQTLGRRGHGSSAALRCKCVFVRGQEKPVQVLYVSQDKGFSFEKIAANLGVGWALRHIAQKEHRADQAVQRLFEKQFPTAPSLGFAGGIAQTCRPQVRASDLHNLMGLGEVARQLGGLGIDLKDFTDSPEAAMKLLADMVRQQQMRPGDPGARATASIAGNLVHVARRNGRLPALMAAISRGFAGSTGGPDARQAELRRAIQEEMRALLQPKDPLLGALVDGKDHLLPLLQTNTNRYPKVQAARLNAQLVASYLQDLDPPLHRRYAPAYLEALKEVQGTADSGEFQEFLIRETGQGALDALTSREDEYAPLVEALRSAIEFHPVTRVCTLAGHFKALAQTVDRQSAAVPA